MEVGKLEKDRVQQSKAQPLITDTTAVTLIFKPSPLLAMELVLQ